MVRHQIINECRQRVASEQVEGLKMPADKPWGDYPQAKLLVLDGCLKRLLLSQPLIDLATVTNMLAISEQLRHCLLARGGP